MRGDALAIVDRNRHWLRRLEYLTGGDHRERQKEHDPRQKRTAQDDLGHGVPAPASADIPSDMSPVTRKALPSP